MTDPKMGGEATGWKNRPWMEQQTEGQTLGQRDRPQVERQTLGQTLGHSTLCLTPTRRLCILKGIYPHEPKHKKKVNKGSTAPRTFYLLKDIKFLLHEPIVNKFREYKVTSPPGTPGALPKGPLRARPPARSPRPPPVPAGVCAEAAQGVREERVEHGRPAEGQQTQLQARPYREGEVSWLLWGSSLCTPRPVEPSPCPSLFRNPPPVCVLGVLMEMGVSGLEEKCERARVPSCPRWLWDRQEGAESSAPPPPHPEQCFPWRAAGGWIMPTQVVNLVAGREGRELASAPAAPGPRCASVESKVAPKGRCCPDKLCGTWQLPKLQVCTFSLQPQRFESFSFCVASSTWPRSAQCPWTWPQALVPEPCGTVAVPGWDCGCPKTCVHPLCTQGCCQPSLGGS